MRGQKLFDESEAGLSPRLQKNYSLALKKRVVSKRRPELFRGVPIARVLDGGAHIFSNQHGSEDWEALPQQPSMHEVATSYSTSSLISQSDSLNVSESASTCDDHALSDRLFYSTHQVNEVDFFISHVWEDPRWQKALALYYYTNGTKACLASLLTWLASAVYLLGFEGGITAYGGKVAKLMLFLGAMPLAAFFSVFFTAHLFTPRHWARTAWLDKLCIHQTRTRLRDAGMQALPEFVANSRHMLILQSPTYFERLWCNLEVATFCAISGASHVEFMPLWLAPWILLSILLNSVSMILVMWLAFIVPYWGAFVEARLGNSTILTTYITLGGACSVLVALAYLPTSLVSFWAMRKKLKARHQLMQQMHDFDIDLAKCTEESDRSLIEEHISKVFEEHPHLGIPPGDCDAGPIPRFNHYIKYDLHNELEMKLGTVTALPYVEVMISFLPLHIFWLVNVLSCDGLDCDVAAVQEGYSSTRAYILCNSLAWVLADILIVPTTLPLVLQTLASLTSLKDGDGEEHSLRNAVETVCSFLLVWVWYASLGLRFGLLQAAMALAFHDPSFLNLAILTTGLSLCAVHCWRLFVVDASYISRRLLRVHSNRDLVLSDDAPRDWTYIDT